VTLCERFAELLEGPSTVTATKQRGALFGVSGNDEALSLRIGEVQQIYPEIWRHLDDARAVLAKRGIDVAAYDQIRAAEGTALGAAVDVKHESHGYGQYGADQTTKNANFNKEGYARARQAADALMRATPDIPWAAIAKAEAEDPNIAAFTSSTKTKRNVMIGLLVLVIAAPFLYVGNTCREEQKKIDANKTASYEEPQLSDAELAAQAIAVTEARNKFAAAIEAWPAATKAEALAALKPSQTPCEYKLDAPTPKEVESFVKYGSVDDNYFDKGAYMTFGFNEPVLDKQLVMPLREVESMAGGGKTVPERLRRLPTHVVFAVIDKVVEPVPQAGTTFKPGEVVGRGYVFSIAQKRIVCAGAIDVRSTPTLVTPPQNEEADQMLFRDLEMQIRQALASSLRAI
jgi:hypothetical protein